MHDWPPKREGGLIGDIELQGLHSPSKYIDITNFPFSSKMGNRGKKTQLTQFTILSPWDENIRTVLKNEQQRRHLEKTFI